MPAAGKSYYIVRDRLPRFLCVSVPQTTNQNLVVCGRFAAGNFQLPCIAAKLPLMTGAARLIQRLRRLLSDRECGTAVTRWCLARGWHFCLRLQKSRWLLLADGTSKRPDSLPLSRGVRLFLSGVQLPALPDRPLNLACGWSTDNKDDESWYILSDLPSVYRVLTLYNVRFHIEAMFRDLKEFGFRLQTIHLRDPERVSRLLLGICLACLADERGRLGHQARTVPTSGPAQAAAAELFPDRLVRSAKETGLRPATPVCTVGLHLKELTFTHIPNIRPKCQ